MQLFKFLFYLLLCHVYKLLKLSEIINLYFVHHRCTICIFVRFVHQKCIKWIFLYSTYVNNHILHYRCIKCLFWYPSSSQQTAIYRQERPEKSLDHLRRSSSWKRLYIGGWSLDATAANSAESVKSHDLLHNNKLTLKAINRKRQING